jgi:hypothetical protein
MSAATLVIIGVSSGLVLFIVIFCAILYRFLSQDWEGKIISLEKRLESTVGPEEAGDFDLEEAAYAVVKCTDGKTRRIRSAGWKKGQHLKKEKWKLNVGAL